MRENINLSVMIGIAIVTLGIGGFIVILLSFDPSLYDTKEMMNAAKIEWFTYGIVVFFGSLSVGAVLIALGRIQAALEAISKKK